MEEDVLESKMAASIWEIIWGAAGRIQQESKFVKNVLDHHNSRPHHCITGGLQE